MNKDTIILIIVSVLAVWLLVHSILNALNKHGVFGDFFKGGELDKVFANSAKTKYGCDAASEYKKGFPVCTTCLMKRGDIGMNASELYNWLWNKHVNIKSKELTEYEVDPNDLCVVWRTSPPRYEYCVHRVSNDEMHTFTPIEQLVQQEQNISFFRGDKLNALTGKMRIKKMDKDEYFN